MKEGINSEHIAKFLTKTDLFKNLESEVINDLSENLEVIHLASGATLINQHEIADGLYIVMYGRLNIVKPRNNKEVVIGEIGSGSLVGEIAILIDQPRQATITAIRDAVVLKMTRQMFNNFLVKYPRAMMDIARESIYRLVESDADRYRKNSKLTNLVVAPAADYPLFTDFARELTAILSTKGPTLYLNKKKFDELFGEGSSETAFQNERNMRLISDLNDLESKYKYIVFESDINLSTWTLRCLALADRVLLVGEGKGESHLGEIETKLFGRYSNYNALIDLILLHDEEHKYLTIDPDWFSHRKCDQHFNLRNGSIRDFEKLIRVIDGKGIGLVLSGGAARGLAHIGVVRALLEAKIPIDYIGGSSMGSLISAFYCFDSSPNGIYELMKPFFPKLIKSLDYTLPLTSLLSGKKIVSLLMDGIGRDTQIENLWEKYFCISTNLTKGQIKVHDEGCLWKAIRASISLPGIFPPLQDVEGDLLVDGGILNNLPVDVMREKLGGGRIIAVNILSPQQEMKYSISHEYLSGWETVFSRGKSFAPNIGNVLMGSMLISSENHLKRMMKNADVGFNINAGEFAWFAFANYKEIIEAGYLSTLKAIADSKLEFILND